MTVNRIRIGQQLNAIRDTTRTQPTTEPFLHLGDTEAMVGHPTLWTHLSWSNSEEFPRPPSLPMPGGGR
jgi:hypothetical protein